MDSGQASSSSTRHSTMYKLTIINLILVIISLGLVTFAIIKSLKPQIITNEVKERFNNNVIMQGDLSVEKDQSVGGDLTVSKSGTFNNITSKNMTFSHDVSGTGNSKINAANLQTKVLTVDELFTTKGNLTVNPGTAYLHKGESDDMHVKSNLKLGNLNIPVTSFTSTSLNPFVTTWFSHTDKGGWNEHQFGYITRSGNNVTVESNNLNNIVKLPTTGKLAPNPITFLTSSVWYISFNYGFTIPQYNNKNLIHLVTSKLYISGGKTVEFSTTFTRRADNEAINGTASGSTIVKLSPNDTVDLYSTYSVYIDAGTAAVGRNNTHIMAFQLA